MVGSRRIGPDLVARLGDLDHAPKPLVPRQSLSRVVDLAPSNAITDLHPAIGQVIKGGQLLSEKSRSSKRSKHDRSTQSDAFGDRCYGREVRRGLIKWRVFIERTPFRA